MQPTANTRYMVAKGGGAPEPVEARDLGDYLNAGYSVTGTNDGSPLPSNLQQTADQGKTAHQQLLASQSTSPSTSTTTTPKTSSSLGLSATQQKQYDQLIAAGASTEAAMQAAKLVPSGGTAQATTQQQAPALTMPASGSVVDLLNMAGQDSSFAARQQLAQQYGIQNYQGTAAQNQELSKKFLEAHNQLKGTTVPQSGSDAQLALQQYQKQTAQLPKGTATQQFYDSYSTLDPVTKQVFDVMQQTLSSINTRTSLTEEIMKLPEFQERADIKAEVLDLKRIMEGTEEDIRAEIVAAGGGATESQVQGLAGARNKVLLKQANALVDQWNVLNDYITAVTDLTKADRAQLQADLETKLGIATTMFNMSQTMKNAERENYQNLVSQIGYNGLAEVLQNNPSQMRQVEQTLNLPKGALSNPAFLQATAPQPKLTTQVVEVDGRKALITFDQFGNPTNAVDLGAASAPGSGGLTPGQVNAFNSIVSKYNASPLIAAADRTPVLSATIANIRKDPSNGAQQLNLAYSYIQALDTYQSAVREGELSLVNSIDSRIGQVKGQIEKIQNGQIVRPEVALQIADAAQMVVDTINSAAKQKAQSYASQANVVGLGPYWNQYVSGFNQGYNQPALGKGSLSSAQYVENTLTGKGYTYQQVLDKTPLGYVSVIDNETGEIGYIEPEEYNPALYTYI